MTQLPVTTIGGYLGAGKTTLINNMLRNAAGQRLAVLVNEFGELPIDEDLIEARDDQMISIAGGCICCSFGDNLIGTLLELSAMTPRPDHILIEASGVAIPQSIAASISLVQAFQLNGVVVLADVETVHAMAQDKYLGDTITRQLSGGDLIILTKVDLVRRSEVKGITDWISTIAGHGHIIPASQGVAPNDILLGQVTDVSTLERYPHSDRGYESCVLRFDRAVDAKGVAKGLATSGCGVMRAKGFVQDLGERNAFVQVVGQRWDVSTTDAIKDQAIVCIGLKGQLCKDKLHAFAKAACVG